MKETESLEMFLETHPSVLDIMIKKQTMQSE